MNYENFRVQMHNKAEPFSAVLRDSFGLLSARIDTQWLTKLLKQEWVQWLGEKIIEERLLFIGPQGTGSRMHTETSITRFVRIQGRKRWLIYWAFTDTISLPFRLRVQFKF